MNDDFANEAMILEETDQSTVEAAVQAAASSFLDPENIRSNVVGLAAGMKWTDGEPTGNPALLALVSQKLPEDLLTEDDLIPSKIEGMDTDVVAVGDIFAGDGAAPAADVGVQTLRTRVRPAEGGYSVGHFAITAGTMATAVYDIQPGGSLNPPRHGIGIPRAYHILSNNHVLANSNNARPGDRILQPGPFDGGNPATDTIAFLNRYIPITFAPAVPLGLHRNLVDAAIATGEFHDIDREVYWIGHVRGWRRRTNVQVGTIVQKSGRTTNYTLGRIIGVGATVNVGYGGGLVARFLDQIITTNMSAPGDSGSLITTTDNVAVGLLFAGSAVATIANQIEHVRSLLRVEVAEEIL